MIKLGDTFQAGHNVWEVAGYETLDDEYVIYLEHEYTMHGKKRKSYITITKGLVTTSNVDNQDDLIGMMTFDEINMVHDIIEKLKGE